MSLLWAWALACWPFVVGFAWRCFGFWFWLLRCLAFGFWLLRCFGLLVLALAIGVGLLALALSFRRLAVALAWRCVGF